MKLRAKWACGGLAVSLCAAAAAGQTTAPAPRVEVPANALLTAGPPGCPVVAVNGVAYDVKTLKRVGPAPADSGGGRSAAPAARGSLAAQPPLNRSSARRFVLSPDGKSAARALEGFTDQGISVYAVATGLQRVKVPEAKGVLFMGFAGNDRMLIIPDFSDGDISVWDLKSNASVGKIHVGSFGGPNHAAVSISGHYLAASCSDWVYVFDTRTGERVATMMPPANVDKRGFSSGTSAMAFSDDTRELAVAAGNRVMAWNNTGHLLFNEEVGPQGQAINSLAWLPDKSGWLINGTYLYDLGTRRVVLRREAAAEPGFGVMVGRDAFVGVAKSPAGATQLQSYAIPWDEIKKGLAAVKSAQPPLLAEGGQIELEMKLEGFHEAQDKATAALTKALTDYFALHHITVAAGAPLKLTVSYSEAAGKAAPVDERADPGGIAAHGTEKTPLSPATIAALALSMTDKAGKPAWTMAATMPGMHYVLNEKNLPGSRDVLIKAWSERLGTMVPTFVGKDAALPVTLLQ